MMDKKPRREDWQKRFSEFLFDKQSKPFRWGYHDCIMFPARAAQAITGHDYVADNAAAGYGYKTKAQAQAVLRKHFKSDIENIFTYFLGKPSKEIEFAGRGDIVVIEFNGEKAGGVIDDTGRRVVCAGPRWLVRLPKSTAVKYWKVGKG